MQRYVIQRIPIHIVCIYEDINFMNCCLFNFLFKLISLFYLFCLNCLGVLLPDGMAEKMVVAQSRIDWLIHKDTILHPRTIAVDMPKSTTTINRQNAINARRQKLNLANRRASGEQVVGKLKI